MQRFLLIILFFYSSYLSAQQIDKEKLYRFGLRGHYGFLLTNSQILDYITHQHLRAYELFLETNTTGKKDWHSIYNFPKIGMAFFVTDYNEKAILGTAYVLYPYLKFSLSKSNFMDLHFSAGSGLAYLSKTFDAENNRKNLAIGSRLNLSFSFLLEADWKLSNSFALSTGIALTHFSNTSFKKPNQGLNMPTINMGFKYSFQDFERAKTELEGFKKSKWENSLHLALAVNEVYPAGGEKYLAKSFSYGMDKKVNRKSKLGGVVDLFYNPANIESLIYDSIPLDSKWQNIQMGISFSHTLLIDNFGLFTSAGYYIISNHKNSGKFYQKIGGRYLLNQNWVINLLLKTHFASAEYLEVGLGYYFRKSKVSNN